MVQLQARYSQVAFEPIFFDVPSLRTLGYKMLTFDADVEKERKK